MTLFLFGISLVGMMTGLVLLIFGLIRKKKLKGGIVLGVSVVLFFASLLMPAPESSTEKVEVASKTQEELNEEKEIEQAKKEEEKKAKEEKLKEEQAAKAAAEQKAKREAEAKLKEEEKNTVEQKQPVTPTKVQSDEDIKNIRKNEIEKTVKNIVKSDLSNTDIKSIEINNYQLEDNKFIVLTKLKWNQKNSKNTTKQMLEMFSDNLAAKLHDDTSIMEVVVFWEVPYHLENANIAKYTYTRATGGMAKTDNWIDSILN
ncbi:hypothetical protein ACIQZG_08265 [Lysinibacillus sp. NPDC096418]|uniref:hypothetical protein n=1 Tax=Lysinibacillus sp. NPDC096418 TaxID=3364138 RepID=UPI003802A023